MTTRRKSTHAHGAYGILEIGRFVDPGLLLLIGTILCGGLVMLTSASISLADQNSGNPFFYFERQMIAVIVGLGGAAARLHIPSWFWERIGLLLVILAIGMLAGVVPSVGAARKPVVEALREIF